MVTACYDLDVEVGGGLFGRGKKGEPTTICEATVACTDQNADKLKIDKDAIWEHSDWCR